ncbi:hypothetical protein DUNSADRAFT_1350 [Dunaliella salina]|uniref:J domain-containing protein n=1 Tax=Dunaliella salina TaxID=3046 RepID=A0ABQ7GX87_DUNSA|nr:hypothetical protein DUNSADRAFT_1350 [Dunaliella salina]|eukprot:KAF5839214.1 hypothetical protein DUNSADRAFT_1350 [Dunaliella salina]
MREGAGPVQSDPVQGHAFGLLHESRWLECVSLLQQAYSTAGATTTQRAEWIFSREALQALIIARTLVLSASKAWSAILNLQPVQWGPAGQHAAAVNPLNSPAAVQRAFRQAAARVHPDKCKLPGAEQAFRTIKHAAERMLATLEQHQESKHEGEGARKGGSGCGGPATTAGAAGGWCGGEGGWGAGVAVDDEEDEEEAYWWWQPWEACAHFTPVMPSTEPSQEDEDPGLWQLPLEELRERVVQCQHAVLQPTSGLSVHQRQRRLRYARSVLSERLAEQSHRAKQEAWSA